MGMVLAFFIAVYILICVLIYKFIITKKTDKKWIKIVSIIIFTLIPTYDIIITNLLGFYYCNTAPKPFIKEIVEYPQSIYFENKSKKRVFYSKDSLIENYLNGLNLKSLALLDKDNRIYLYTATKYDWKEFYDTADLEVIEVIKNRIKKNTEQIYTIKNAPKLNYTVRFSDIALNKFTSLFLIGFKTEIFDNSTSELIAYDENYYKFYYNFFPNLEYDTKKGDTSEMMCGYTDRTNIYEYVFGYVVIDKKGQLTITDKVIHNSIKSNKGYKDE